MNELIEILKLAKVEGSIDDEFFVDDKRVEFVKITDRFFKYCRDNYLPYDLEDDTSEFCCNGGVIKYNEEYYSFELWNGQGTVAIVSYLENVSEIINFATVDEFILNERHRCYFKNREDVIFDRVRKLFIVKSLDKDSVENICKRLIDENY